MRHPHHRHLQLLRPALQPLLSFFLVLLLAGCADGERETAMTAQVERPVLETKADSVAMQAYEALGGPEAWAALRYLRFDFGAEDSGGRQVRRKHLWNRHTGAYRLEWTAGADSHYVALFNVNDRQGQVYLNGTPLEASENQQRLEQAYRSFINDTYWMLAPVKMLDPGVQRSYVADSSDADTDVVLLSFQDVGLTPGDRYYLYVDRQTGRVNRWHYVLESGNTGRHEWTGYEAFETPQGSVYVATRKEAVGRPFTMLTDNVEMPARVPDELFTDPSPRLN